MKIGAIETANSRDDLNGFKTGTLVYFKDEAMYERGDPLAFLDGTGWYAAGIIVSKKLSEEKIGAIASQLERAARLVQSTEIWNDMVAESREKGDSWKLGPQNFSIMRADLERTVMVSVGLPTPEAASCAEMYVREMQKYLPTRLSFS